MARTKAAGFDKQRAAIRDAAAREFADKGYAAATIADIAYAEMTCDIPENCY